MDLVRAFEVQPKEVIALVGAGGKTTLLFRLAAELAAGGRHVVTTTTTRLGIGQLAAAPCVARVEKGKDARPAVREALQRNAHVLVAGPDAPEGKVRGLEPARVDEIAALEEVDTVIVEADGAKLRPFKAPAGHEPVIPASTTLLVPVAGMDVLGLSLTEAHVHRPERVATLAGVEPGGLIDAGIVARVLGHRQGGLKCRPPGARVVAFLNKAEDETRYQAARAIARELLGGEGIAAVVIGALYRAQAPILEVRRRVAVVILAAGGSLRMGGPLKQLLPWGGTTFVRHTVDLVGRAQVTEIVVVVGNQGAAVAAQVEGTGARIVFNPAWKEGRATSVRAGVQALGAEIAAALFVNADQPFLTPGVLDAIVERYARTLAPIVVPVYDGQTGSPVLFDRALFGDLTRLEGESGGKQILQARQDGMERVTIEDARAGIDVDTMEQYRAALALTEN